MGDVLKALRDLDAAALVNNGRLLRVTLDPNAFHNLVADVGTEAEFIGAGREVFTIAGPGGYIEVHLE